jgi:hypothetical protein
MGWDMLAPVTPTVVPKSTTRVCPLMDRPASLDRKRAALAMSWATQTRPFTGEEEASTCSTAAQGRHRVRGQGSARWLEQYAAPAGHLCQQPCHGYSNRNAALQKHHCLLGHFPGKANIRSPPPPPEPAVATDLRKGPPHPPAEIPRSWASQCSPAPGHSPVGNRGCGGALASPAASQHVWHAHPRDSQSFAALMLPNAGGRARSCTPAYDCRNERGKAADAAGVCFRAQGHPYAGCPQVALTVMPKGASSHAASFVSPRVAVLDAV